ncbi:MAG: NUDIX domain-containing protein [Peptoniphilaceae bacterium]|nr:NUDIX domain-containing protein [Peptoniphilaceae bacterium]MDD7382875.1 NUDIX domain-containing protein [Peptoniphilaceae bacterium]MDY3738166.1 NUDIX domain-containing protein [Peptoniphilaceae bacterium]
MIENSSGGVVIRDGKVLLLKRKKGGWVLPKGRIEKNETKKEAAIREVFEESGVIAKPLKFLGYSKYNFKGNSSIVKKTVYYYLMKVCKSDDLKAQTEEGFLKACFIDYNKAITLLIHKSEISMVKNAFYIYKG